ncbi:unnamed protein product, partial [Allacma fusca]
VSLVSTLNYPWKSRGTGFQCTAPTCSSFECRKGQTNYKISG